MAAVSNEEIIERLMRMGVEHRSGVPLSDLWAQAERELAEEKRKAEAIIPDCSWEDWLKLPVRYALNYHDGRMRVMRFVQKDDLFVEITLVAWRTPVMPEVTFKYVEVN